MGSKEPKTTHFKADLGEVLHLFNSGIRCNWSRCLREVNYRALKIWRVISSTLPPAKISTPEQSNVRLDSLARAQKYDVYLFYKPDSEYLKNTALTLDMARSLRKGSGKRRLVFAPTKYLDGIHLEEHRIDFCQLPFEIYKAAKPKK